MSKIYDLWLSILVWTLRRLSALCGSRQPDKACPKCGAVYRVYQSPGKVPHEEYHDCRCGHLLHATETTTDYFTFLRSRSRV